MNTPPAPPPAPLMVAALRGHCPQCGAPTLFDGMIRFASSCRSCGADFTQFNVGDGPAAFLTLIVGTFILILALALEFGLHPPLWLHLLLWPVVTVAAVVACLRVAKGMLLTLEYRNRAREGRLRDGGGTVS